jgi:hypothetical protein
MNFDLLKTNSAGNNTGGGLNQVYLALADDILNFPERDAQNKAVISGNITFKTGKGWNLLYVTKGEQEIKEAGNDTRDNNAYSTSFEAYHPGLAEPFRQFVSENGHKEFYLLVFDCDETYPKLIGRKCSPAMMKVDVASGKAVSDKKGNTMTFTSEGPYLAAIYKGAFNPANAVIPANEDTPDVEDGVSFVTSANTQATEITDLLNAVVGSTVMLQGGSNTNPSTIDDGGNFSLAGAATMTLSAGSFIDLFVRGAHDFVELRRG